MESDEGTDVEAPRSPLAALASVVMDRMPELIDAIRAALADGWPAYAAFLDDRRDEVMPAAALAVRRLVTLSGTAAVEEGFEGALFEEVGRIQWREGWQLSTLLSAYQTAARVFWRHMSMAALEVEVATGPLAELAEGVFTFVDRLSTASARGYVEEQTRSGAEREHRREDLVALLLSDRADAAGVAEAAERAGWVVPERVALVVVDAEGRRGREVLARADSTMLPVRTPTLTGVIVPAPSRFGRREELAMALRGAGAVVGVAVPPDRLPASRHIAEIAARLRYDGVLDDDPLFVDDHLDAVIVHQDQPLLDELRRRVLEPLERAVPGSRDRLRESLLAWLRHQGDRQQVAAELHVHPQTVSYRLARLHELFGDELDRPEGRARLMLALAWR